jgi:hypothetical protein
LTNVNEEGDTVAPLDTEMSRVTLPSGVCTGEMDNTRCSSVYKDTGTDTMDQPDCAATVRLMGAGVLKWATSAPDTVKFMPVAAPTVAGAEKVTATGVMVLVKVNGPGGVRVEPTGTDTDRMTVPVGRAAGAMDNVTDWDGYTSTGNDKPDQPSRATTAVVGTAGVLYCTDDTPPTTNVQVRVPVVSGAVTRHVAPLL